MAPITFRVQIAQFQHLLLTMHNARYGLCNFAGHKRATTARTLVIKQNAICCINVVCLTVVDDNPIGVLLGNGWENKHSMGWKKTNKQTTCFSELCVG
jgi:hypothetical protein